MPTLPRQMLGIVLGEYHEQITKAIDSLRVTELPVPTPGDGQVLVRVEAAPCNPSDLLLMQGKYGSLKTLPAVPGLEGAGVVVASGSGMFAKWLRGKRVAFGGSDDRGGTWAQYAIANATQCIPLKKNLRFRDAASLIVNPITAFALLDIARRGGHKAAVHTAGASQLGRMMIAMAAELKYPLINVVRRAEQVELLDALGATNVVNSSADSFVEQLQRICQQLQATIAFEAVGGEMTGTVLNLLPPNSTVHIYGALSEETCRNLEPVELIFRGKSVTGFFLGDWLQTLGLWKSFRVTNRVQQMILDGVVKTQFQRKVTLDDFSAGLRQYVDHMTDGKILIRPNAG